MGVIKNPIVLDNGGDIEQDIFLDNDFAVINEYLKLDNNWKGWLLLIGRTIFFDDDDLAKINFGNENNVAYHCYPLKVGINGLCLGLVFTGDNK